MKLLPDTTGMRAFLGWLNYEKYKEGAQFQEVQRVLISTNQNREPKGSIYLETFFEQQWQQKPSSPSNGLPMRCQSEEPAMKKRKHFMVDTEELEEASRVVKACRIPVKPVTKPVVKEVISLVDEEKYDPPWLEPGVIYTLEQRVQYHKDREKAKEDARLAAAARNAQQPQPQKEGPFTTIHDRRDEHEKKQRAEAAANKRRFSLVNNSLRGDSMTKSSIPSGVRPTNRLGQSKPQQASQRDSKEPWSRPSHIPPFKHLTIADKKQRTDHGSVITKSSPASPIDLDEDTLDRQGHDSVARSGYSHTMNESQKNTTRREMYVDEFRSSEDITKINSKRPRQRRNGHSNGVGNGGGTHKYRIPNGSIINAGDREDSADPIVDPEIELIGKRAFKKSSVLEVQIPSYEPNIYNQSRNHPDSNANAKSIRNKGIFPSTSETPLSSPHFAMFGDDDHKKSSKARQTSKLMAANGNPRSMGQDGRVSTSNAPRSSHPDTGLDELGEDQFEPGERSDFETAQALIRKQKATREQRPPSQHESINLDDSDEDNSAEANIIPTQFKTESKNPDVVGTYELRQLFSRPKIWLRDTDKKTWTMTLNKKIHCLQSFDEQGNTNLSFLTNPFKFFEWHKESSKVAIHRPRDHQASNGTEIFLEFSSLGQREQFVKDMRAVYKTLNVIHIQKEDGNTSTKSLTRPSKATTIVHVWGPKQA
ncbi:hypothetical protein BDZ45DRAFT_281618 [Acephala macrosclerotiorum]|nr:hypothetical protein BDZ45DRAFT_281618 [Acephala macrosclerotiorum]